MITQMTLGGYRLLNNFTASLGQLTVVIGANAVGKSTLLDSLQCISQCVEFPLNTVIGWHWGMDSLLSADKKKAQELSWEIKFSLPKQWSWLQPQSEDELEIVYDVRLSTDALGRASMEREVLRAATPRPGYAEPLKYMEASPRQRRIFDRRTHRLEPFDEALPSSASDSSLTGDLAAAQAQEPALMLSQIRFFNEFPIPSLARVSLANMAFYLGFDVGRLSTLRTKAAEIKPVAVLAQTGENLGTVLHEVLNRYEYRTSANNIRDALKTAYPTFEEIHCDTTFGTPPQVLVRIREKGMPRSMEVWEVSDGTLRFLCLATALLGPVAPPIIAIDEPEVGLHPRLLPIVADIIKMASERTQVLVTTHSPDLLTRFNISDVAVMVRDEADVKAGWRRPSDQESLLQMLENLGGQTLADLHRSGELEAIE